LRRLTLTGIWIAIIGPDGCGKSTLLQHLKPLTDRAFPSGANRIVHLRPKYLPRIHHLLSRKRAREEAEEVVSPHGAKPSGKLGSLFRLLYYLVDYIFGYFPKIRRRLARNAFVLFDRYYYDLIVDPRRVRIDLPGWFVKMFFHLAPQPDLVIYLDCSPEVLHSRKKELTMDELVGLVPAYRELVKTLPNAIVLSGHQPIESLVQQVLQVTLAYKSRQFRRRARLPFWKTGVLV